MKSWIALWLIVAAVFLVADLIWLKWLGRGFYETEMGAMLRVPPNLAAAASFYFVYVTGLVVFVVPPAAIAQPLWQTVAFAILFGLVCYGAYDLTGLAVLKGFTARIAVIDLAWGTFATTVTAAIAVFAARALPLGIFMQGIGAPN
jgi:uncharacterized membrane protein